MKRDLRLEELLAQRALEGLTAEDSAQLSDLGGEEDDTFDRAAAALTLAWLPDEKPLSEALTQSILARATGAPSVDQNSRQGQTSSVRALVRAPLPSWPAWAAAAAGLVLAVGAWGWALTRQPAVVVVPASPSAVASAPAAPASTASPSAHVLAVADAVDAHRYAWKPTKDPASHGAAGEVVWSNAEQTGYMRFVGIAPNDPKQSQYQLWIFDAERDAKYPVDGGVFDVPSRGVVIVPILAKLRVNEPKLFAVTVEKPGGVVVSKRERVVVTAEVDPL